MKFESVPVTTIFPLIIFASTIFLFVAGVFEILGVVYSSPFSSKYVTLQSVHSASLGFAVTCAEDGEPFVTAFKSQLQTAIVISSGYASLNLNYATTQKKTNLD